MIRSVLGRHYIEFYRKYLEYFPKIIGAKVHLERGLPASCENPQYDRIGKEDEDLQWVLQFYPVEAGFVHGWEC